MRNIFFPHYLSGEPNSIHTKNLYYNPLLTLEYNNKYFQDDVKS